MEQLHHQSALIRWVAFFLLIGIIILAMILFIPFTAILKQVFEEVDYLRPYAYFIGDEK